jgi:hypothetical protein
MLRVALPVMPNRVHLIILAWRQGLNPWNLLFVLLHLEHQTMDKVHKTDDLKRALPLTEYTELYKNDLFGEGDKGHIIPPHWMLHCSSTCWNLWGVHQMLAKFQHLFILNTFWHLSYYATKSLIPNSHPSLNFFTTFWRFDISLLPGNLLRLSPFQNLENHHSSPVLIHLSF